MFVTNSPADCGGGEILSYVPHRIRKYLYASDLSRAEEIRLRAGMAVTVQDSAGIRILTEHGRLEKNPKNPVKASRSELGEGLELVTGASVYASQEEIKNGFVTVEGGHRVGLCGSAVMTGNRISYVKNVSGLNYRFAREILTAAEGIVNAACGKNTLIISPPGCGKTTVLRDLIRRISDMGQKVSVIDERREIAGMYDGMPSFDIGANTDVLCSTPKAEGILMMLRSMSPDVIAVDELADEEELAAVKKAYASGTSVIATMHGGGRERMSANGAAELFDCIITLSRRKGTGTVEEIYNA